MHFTVEKITKHLHDIKKSIYRDVSKIKSFKFAEGQYEGAHLLDFDDSKWETFETGSNWGGYDITAWFRTTVEIPKSWANEKMYIRLIVGPEDGGASTAESLLYVDGKPLQGIDGWHEEAWLPTDWIEGKDEISISIKSWSGVLGVPDKRRFTVAELIKVDKPAEHLWHMSEALLKSIEILGENDIRKLQLIEMLNNAFLMIDFLNIGSDEYYESILKAEQYLDGQIKKKQEIKEVKPKVTAVGHSHIDMEWLWRLKDTKEKASRTFSTVLNLMRQYPEYNFLQSSPQLYKYLKEDYPDIYEEIRKKISSGEWEITGGMWVEPDTNVPSGESLIRQILFGKRFMQEEFNINPKLVWLPDVFGYSGALPQIMKKSGMDYFMTTKISWNQYNRFPLDTFNWRGIDGTEILTHFITTPDVSGQEYYTYNGNVRPEDVDGLWNNYRQKDINDELLLSFGWGDGGGGPTTEMLESARVLKNLPGIPEVEVGKAEPYFERLEKRLEDKKVDVWDGELYLEYHRGTYTSQAFMKRYNRKSEVLYHDAEWLSTVADIITGQDNYPQEKLNSGWEKILLKQFHDCLPGTSIRQVYEDSRIHYKYAEDIGVKALNTAQDNLVSNMNLEDNSVVLFNSLPWSRNDIVEIPESELINENTVLIDDEENTIKLQKVDQGGHTKYLAQVNNMPSLGYKAYTISNGKLDKPVSKLKISKDILENDFYKIELNENGQITSIYDKKNDRQVLAESERGNVFQAFEDKPLIFDAWDIEVYYEEKMTEITNLIKVEVEEEGPLRATLKLEWEFNKSTITQRISIYKDSPRIDFKTDVDWDEKQVLLKVAFPVDIRSTYGTYDIQFGNLERPTHRNTEWDFAQFEVVGHKWVDLSEGNYGVSLLNDCKYGHDIRDNVMRLTLIKSSIDPDETADRGEHEFTYSLLPHKGQWRESQVVEEAHKLNYPVLTSQTKANIEGQLPAVYEFAKLDIDNAMIETVKKSEDDNAWIIRIYEFEQSRNKDAKISFSENISKAVECNLVEEDEKECSYFENEIEFSIDPYEIKTFKVWFK